MNSVDYVINVDSTQSSRVPMGYLLPAIHGKKVKTNVKEKHTGTAKKQPQTEEGKLKPGEKYCLTVEEAAAYFEINDKKIRALAKDHADEGIFVKHGVKLLILRPQFETYLTKTPEI